MSQITLDNLDVIWNALIFYREHGIPEGDKEYDAEWNEICTSMAWIAEDLGLNSSITDEA